MNSVEPKSNCTPASRARMAAGLLSLGLAAQTALAGIDVGGSDAYPNNPELFLTLIDRTAQMSYTLDLNVRAATFAIAAQQDTGSYLFFTLDPSIDAALQTFVTTAGTDLTTARWAVLGFNVSLANSAQRVLYSTLTNNGSTATQTASYDSLFTKLNNGTFKTSNGLKSYIDGLNGGDPALGTIAQSTLNTSATFGSSLATIANAGTYASKLTGWVNSTGATDGDCLFGGPVCVGNPVGTSSWFYQTQVSGSSSLAKVAVDEFDNITNDGYWGFIKDPNSGKYILSYTLPGSNPHSLVSTAEGRTRLSFTDYSASSGSARLITVASDDIANAGLHVATGVSAVPEPQTWSLMALGGLLLAARVRRERRAAGLSGQA